MNNIPCVKCRTDLFRLNANLELDVETEFLLIDENVQIVSVEHYYQADTGLSSNTITYTCLKCGIIGKIYINSGGKTLGTIDCC
jgi:hypothetical protein